MDIQEKIGKLKSIVNGYKAARVISSAEQLKIFDVLDKEPTTSDILSEKLSIDKEKLEAILYALVCLKLIEKNEQGFFMDIYFDVLSPKAPRNQLGYIRHATTMMNKWTNLTNAAQSSNIKKENFSAITGQEKESTEAFIQAMNANALPQAKYISDNYSFNNSYILDIGAGAGTYSIFVGKKYNTSKGILMDLPAVCEIISKNIQTNELKERFQVVSGDYNNGIVDGKEFDDIFLFAVAHQENDTNLKILLKRAFDALKPGGRLFMSSFFLNEDRSSPEFSVMFAIEMLVMSPNGKVYTHAEIQQYVKEAGFTEIERIDDVPGPATLYIAKK